MYLRLGLAWILPTPLLRVSSTRRLSGWLHRHPLTRSHSADSPTLSLLSIVGLLVLLPVVRFIVSRSSHNLYAATPSIWQCTRNNHTRIYRKELKLNLFITRIRSHQFFYLFFSLFFYRLLRVSAAAAAAVGSERGNRATGEG